MIILNDHHKELPFSLVKGWYTVMYERICFAWEDQFISSIDATNFIKLRQSSLEFYHFTEPVGNERKHLVFLFETIMH
jgi:hypothetical protein